MSDRKREMEGRRERSRERNSLSIAGGQLTRLLTFPGVGWNFELTSR